jgi:hypothetical protein
MTDDNNTMPTRSAGRWVRGQSGKPTQPTEISVSVNITYEIFTGILRRPGEFIEQKPITIDVTSSIRVGSCHMLKQSFRRCCFWAAAPIDIRQIQQCCTSLLRR